VKKSCLSWLVVYLLLAGAIGAIVYRRFPTVNAALGGAIVGSFAATLGLGYLIGIRQKVAEALMIQRASGGEPPRDGEKMAAIGRISPVGGTLVSPLSRTACVAYKYEIRSSGKSDAVLYSGFALTPSAIQSTQGTIRLLAYPDLKVQARSVPSHEAQPNAEEYIRSTEFRKPSLGNIRESFAEMMKDFKDDDGSIRTDQQNTGYGSADLQHARFIEWVVQPGDQICAIGRYASQRGGLVPDSAAQMEPVTITEGLPEGFVFRAIRGAFGYLIGGLIFLGAVVVGLAALFVFVPLEASEQMDPTLMASWPEIRLERFIEKRLRLPMRQAGMLDAGTVKIELPPGSARGRLRAGGREVLLTRADAVRTNDETSISLDVDTIVLAIDGKNRPLRLRLLGEEMTTSSDPEALDLRITENSREEVAGRLTWLPAAGDSAACRVAFRAKVQNVGPE
jgi:hypothetical protein